ncbi:hypothetical protein SAMN05421766_1174 [Zobellia uliginosa]|uniref:Uncharacterized protein n=1 Tax=Zobellia uliginosa TaxID=143224 RepID=A0ABY1L475_9FLAO|nr:hypothetical protein SAMN05421766_1174 [Zobellia uliginosa]
MPHNCFYYKEGLIFENKKHSGCIYVFEDQTKRVSITIKLYFYGRKYTYNGSRRRGF